MVTAEDDEDSDNDCLYIDETPTEPVDQTSSSTQDIPDSTISKNQDKNSSQVPVNYLALMSAENVKNIPYHFPDITKDQVETNQSKARIACKDFSRKPFDTNASALYYYLTTDAPQLLDQSTVPNNLITEGSQPSPFLEHKQLLQAPMRPSTINSNRRPGAQTASMIPQVKNNPITPPIIDGGQNENQMPQAQGALSRAIRQTGVIVPHSISPSGGTMTYGPPKSDQEQANLPTTMSVSSDPIQNGQPPSYSEAYSRQAYVQHSVTEFYGEIMKTHNQGALPYRTCEHGCQCRKGPMSQSSLNFQPARGAPMNMSCLSPFQAIHPTLHPPVIGKGGAPIIMPPVGPQHPPTNPFVNSQQHPINPSLSSQASDRRGGPMNMLPLDPQHQAMNPFVYPQRYPLKPSLNPHHQSKSALKNSQPHTRNPSLSPQATCRKGAPMNMPPLDPQHHEINLFLNPQLQSTNSSLSPHQQSMNALRNPHNHSINASLSPQYRSMNLRLHRQHQSMRTSLNPPIKMMNPPLNPQHTRRRGGVKMSPVNPQHESINPSLNPKANKGESPMNFPDLYTQHPSFNIQHQSENPPLSFQHQSTNSFLNPQPNKEGSPMDMPLLDALHEFMNPPSKPQHQTTNPLVNPQHHTMIPPINPQHQTINPPVYPQNQITNTSVIPQHQYTNPPVKPQHQTMSPPVYPQHQTTYAPLNPQQQIMRPPLNPQHQTINPSVYPQNQITNPPVIPQHQYTNPPVKPQHQTMSPPVYHQHLTTYAPLNPQQQIMSPPLNPQHQTINPPVYPQNQITNSPVVPQHQTMNPSVNPQHHTINPPINPQDETMSPPVYLQHQTTNPQPNVMEEALSMPPLNLNQIMNPLNAGSTPKAKQRQCWSCSMSMPCDGDCEFASSSPNDQTEVPKPNSTISSLNSHAQSYNRNGPILQNLFHIGDDVHKAAYLAATRSQSYLQTKTSNIMNADVPVVSQATVSTKANERAKIINALNDNASEAGSTGSSLYNPDIPYITSNPPNPVTNKHTVTRKRAVKTTTNDTKISIANNTQAKSIPPSKINNIQMPHTDLTPDTPDIMQAPLKTELAKPTNNMRIETTQTEVITTAHNINPITLLRAPLGEEVQSKPTTTSIDNNGALTHLIEDTPSDNNEEPINTDQPWIKIKSDRKQIPLIMDEEHNSIKDNVERKQIPLIMDEEHNSIKDNVERKQIPLIMDEEHNSIKDNVERKQIPLIMDEEHNSIKDNVERKQIPLIMDEEHNSIKDNVETTTQTSAIQTTTRTHTENVKSETFAEQSSNNIDVETALALLHEDTDGAQTNNTQTSKALVQSTNTYTVVSATSVTAETTSHNIENNNIVLRPETFNDEAQTRAKEVLTVNQIIEQTVTVEIINKMITNPNISLPRKETLQVILNKAQAIQAPCKNNNQTDITPLHNHKNNVDTKQELINTGESMELTRKGAKHTNETMNNNITIGDGYTKEHISHERKEVINSEDDDKLKIARKKLLRLRVLECENENKLAASCNDSLDSVTTGMAGDYISVRTPSYDGSSVKVEEFYVDCFTGTTARTVNANSIEYILLPERETITEIDRQIDEADKSQEDTNKTCVKSELIIHEMIFFKFQIYFFRLVQERLSENRYEKMAIKLYKDILDLIDRSEGKEAKADFKYECHLCHNVATFSPRLLYYNRSDYLEHDKDNAHNCKHCITFRNKYIDILMKYIQVVNSRGITDTEYTDNNQITEKTENNVNREDTTTGTINEIQINSDTPLYNNDSVSTKKQKMNENIKKQSSLIINEESISSKEAQRVKLKYNTTNTPDKKNQSHDFIVKLPRHMLKESTLEALIQRKNGNSNNGKPGKEGETLKIALDDQFNNYPNHHEEIPNKETDKIETNTTEDNRNSNRSINDNIQDKEKHSISNKNSELQNKITKNSSTFNIDDKNQERQPKKRKIISDKIASSPNLEQQHRNAFINNTVINDACQKKYDKRSKINSILTLFSTNPENTTKVPEDKKVDDSHEVSENKKDDDKIQKRQSIKRKSISAENELITNADLRNTNDISFNDNKKENHFKKRKSVCVETETITIPETQNRDANIAIDDKNQDGYSKTRKRINTEYTTSINNESQNTNIASNNNVQKLKVDRHSKKRKSISNETAANTNVRLQDLNTKISITSHDRDDNYKNNEANEIRKSNCCQITTSKEKRNCNEDAATKYYNEDIARKPSVTKSISSETAIVKNVEPLKIKIITMPNEDSDNKNNNETSNPTKNHDIAKNTNRNKEVLTSNGKTSTNKHGERFKIASNNNKDNVKNLTRNSESRKSGGTYVLGKIRSKPSSQAKETTKTDFAEKSVLNKNNNDDKQNDVDTRKKPDKTSVEDNDKNRNQVDMAKALKDCIKSLKENGHSMENNEFLGNLYKTLKVKLNSDDKDDLPEVNISGKKQKTVVKTTGVISYRYICSYCSVSFRSLTSCEAHVANDHQKVNIVPKDCIEMIKCSHCSQYVKPTLYNIHVKTRHKEIYSQRVEDK